MAETIETLLNSKLDRGGYFKGWNNTDNFVEEKELTVTITLAEYRELVSDHAKSQYKIDEANNDKYTRDNQNKQLKERNKELENIILQYRVKFGELEESREE